MKPLVDAKQIPGILTKKFQAAMSAVLGSKETSLRSYVLIGQYYVSKRLLLLLTLLLLVIAYFLFIRPPVFINKLFNWVPVMQENTPKTAAYSGKAKVIDDQRIARYEGELVDGFYAGKGKLFGKQGNLLYEGDFDKGQKKRHWHLER